MRILFSTNSLYFVMIIVIFVLSILIVHKQIGDFNHPEEISQEFQRFSTKVKGFSGICLGNSDSTFFALSDDKGIYEIDTLGSFIQYIPLSKKHDWEGICRSSSGSMLYLVDESNVSIYSFEPKENILEKIFKVEIGDKKQNKGLEGITVYNDTMYVVNQQAPTQIIVYNLNTKSEINRISVDFAKYLSDIFFDITDKTLWICDAKAKKIYHCSTSGTLLDTQKINFVDKAEAIYIDRTKNVAYIGCDKSASLYKVVLKI